MKPETIGVVVNPVSGKGKGESYLEELEEIFSDAETNSRITQNPSEVTEAAREMAGNDLLVSIGGDGTLREVTESLIETNTDPSLFVVPAGRGNSSYRHLYGEYDWRRAAKAINRGFKPAPLEVGEVSSEPEIQQRFFVLGFTAGLFRSAVSHAETFNALPGTLAYVLGTARAVIADPPVTAEVHMDDEEIYSGDARLIALGGGRYRGSDFELFPDSAPGDRTLHCIIVEPSGIRGSIDLVRKARNQSLTTHPSVHYAKGRRATVKSQRGLPVEMDGSVIETPLSQAEIDIHPDAVNYAYPESEP